MSETLATACTVCGNAHTRSVQASMAAFISARTGVNGEDTRINFCPQCEHAFFTPFLTEEQLGTIYEGYRTETYDRDRLAVEPWYEPYIAMFADKNSGYYVSRKAYYDFFLSEFKNFKGMVTDFGGADGEFSRHIFHDAEVVVADFGYEAAGGDMNGLLARTDLLFCAHVFEHIPQPTEVLTSLVSRLRPGTLVYIELPLEYGGRLSDAFAQLEANRAIGVPPQGAAIESMHEHIAHFSKRSACMLMTRSGVRIEQVFHSINGILSVIGRKI